ncbi:MAG: hypothetical protein WC556_07595 [Candidatus Methanoperedens sp.]
MNNKNKYQYDISCKKVNITEQFHRLVLCMLFLTLALPIPSSAAIPADGSFVFIAWADSRGTSLYPGVNGNINNGMLNKTFVTRGNLDTYLGTLSNLTDWQGLWNISTIANSVGAANYVEPCLRHYLN